MGAGDAPRSDVERRPAGPPIGSGRGPARVGAEAKVGNEAHGDAFASIRLVQGAGAARSARFRAAREVSIRPPLKHGPRSSTYVRSQRASKPVRRKEADFDGIPLAACTVDRP
ncbi:hypothetical protein LOK49_LG14G01668 [Camellia lanceoleosa]|uniref:Uncharacterized protein n=1 Tax=Camellia lanceoleosa TaxID=1840588 RepID=A0ACC0F9X1_9ERIC|nr:hypothetical protein LOK49_LG14G01668 [Camellia lanceoleosa]